MLLVLLIHVIWIEELVPSQTQRSVSYHLMDVVVFCSIGQVWFCLQIDEELVQTSGKFLILDRLLPALKKRGHKVNQSVQFLPFASRNTNREKNLFFSSSSFLY